MSKGWRWFWYLTGATIYTGIHSWIWPDFDGASVASFMFGESWFIAGRVSTWLRGGSGNANRV